MLISQKGKGLTKLEASLGTACAWEQKSLFLKDLKDKDREKEDHRNWKSI